MLVLTRRLGERIRISDTIVVTVVSIKGSKVQLGIEAPPEVPVDREEVWERRKGFEEPARRKVLVGSS